MKEYTILAILSVALVIVLDLVLKTKLFFNRNFRTFWIIMTIVMFIVNGYLTWRPVVTYGTEFFLGFRIFTIPVEDFLYGFSLLSANIIIWEFLSRKEKK